MNTDGLWSNGVCCPTSEAAAAAGLVLHLLKELVRRVFVAVLLHLGEVALLGGHGGVNLESKCEKKGVKWHINRERVRMHGEAKMAKDTHSFLLSLLHLGIWSRTRCPPGTQMLHLATRWRFKPWRVHWLFPQLNSNGIHLVWKIHIFPFSVGSTKDKKTTVEDCFPWKCGGKLGKHPTVSWRNSAKDTGRHSNVDCVFFSCLICPCFNQIYYVEERSENMLTEITMHVHQRDSSLAVRKNRTRTCCSRL